MLIDPEFKATTLLLKPKITYLNFTNHKLKYNKTTEYDYFLKNISKPVNMYNYNITYKVIIYNSF